MNYPSDVNWNDPRNTAGENLPDFDPRTMTLRIVLGEDDEGEEIEARVPARFEVCSVCNGHGSYVNPAIDDCGLSSEDFYADPGFEEDYFAGVYDVTCAECGGKNVVPVPDKTRIDKGMMKQIEDWQRREAAYRAEEAWERRMGY